MRINYKMKIEFVFNGIIITHRGEQCRYQLRDGNVENVESALRTSLSSKEGVKVVMPDGIMKTYVFLVKEICTKPGTKKIDSIVMTAQVNGEKRIEYKFQQWNEEGIEEETLNDTER